MARHFAWALLAMFVAVPASAAAPQQGADVTQSESHGRQEEKNRESRSQDQNRVKWWIDPERRKEFGITDAQSAQIDEIFESTMPDQRAKWRERNRQEDVVSKLLKDHSADVATVSREVQRLEALNAELATTRTMMLYKTSLVLTPEQSVKLEEYNKRRAENRRKSDRR